MFETFSVLDNNNLFVIPALSIFLKEWCSTVVLKTLFPFFMGKIWNVWENSCYRINYAKKGEAFLSFLWRKRLMSVRLRVYSAAKMLNAVSSTYDQLAAAVSTKVIFFWDQSQNMSSSDFLPKKRPLIGWPIWSTNYRPVFLAENHLNSDMTKNDFS